MEASSRNINEYTEKADPTIDSSEELPTDQPKWEPEAEIRARFKVDTSVLPLLFLGLLVFQLDRMNLASALTGGFAQDIDITQDTVNLGNQMMFLGIVVLEIPFNLILQKLGPRKWISAQVFMFGLIATLQVFVHNRNGFLVARSFLGLAEAGYIPGSIYTLSTWYKRRELAKRVAIFFFGMFGGNALSPILASGILHLDGTQGLTGWQWLFLLEGVFTMVVAVLLLLVLPGSPDQPKPLLLKGLVCFTAEDQRILQERLASDDTEKQGGAQGLTIPWKLVRQTLLHYKRWPSLFSTFCVFATWSPLTTYTPSIYVDLGFDRISANALASVGGSLALIVVFIFAWVSDRTNKRGYCVMAAQICYLVTLVVARQVQPSVGRWGRWGLWTVVNSFAVGYHPIHNTWVQLNCKYPGERSISIAMWVMFAISGLMVGTQLFRGDDVPDYNNGLLYMIGLVSAGIVLAAAQEVVYVVHNGKVQQGTGRLINGELEPRSGVCIGANDGYGEGATRKTKETLVRLSVLAYILDVQALQNVALHVLWQFQAVGKDDWTEKDMRAALAMTPLGCPARVLIAMLLLARVDDALQHEDITSDSRFARAKRIIAQALAHDGQDLEVPRMRAEISENRVNRDALVSWINVE